MDQGVGSTRVGLKATSHLHVHLEPGERRLRELGNPQRRLTTPREFFEVHSLAYSGRTRIELATLDAYVLEVHADNARAGVDYVELRFSPRRYLADGARWEDYIVAITRACARLERPRVRPILLVNRDFSNDQIDAYVDLITGVNSDDIVGIDLAGDESRFPDDRRFVRLFSLAASRGLGLVAHAGESGRMENVWIAIDELGVSRLGHALAAPSSAGLLARLAQDNILVETSLTSNRALGMVRSPDIHPVVDIVQAGVPVCFNLDVPVHTGATWSEEIAAASAALRLSELEVIGLQESAMGWAFGR